MSTIIPDSKITLNIEGNSYVVNFPKNRDFIKIEAEKSRLSEGEYSSLSYRSDNSGFLAKLVIDTTATFSVLIPNLIKDLNVRSYMDLDLLQQNRLTLVYLEQFYPWYSSWITLLSNPSKIEENDTIDEKGNNPMEQ